MHTVFLNTNAEMLFFDFEDTSMIDDSDVARVYDAGFDVFKEFDIEWAYKNVSCSNRFKDWNGGKFSHQAKMYGYKVSSFFAVDEKLASETLLDICYKAQTAMENEVMKIWESYYCVNSGKAG